MKKNVFQIILSVLLISGVGFFLSSCKKENSKHCGSDKPYYCKTAKSCCKYKYNDGKGTCFSSLSDCTATGNGCETCWIEED